MKPLLIIIIVVSSVGQVYAQPAERISPIDSVIYKTYPISGLKKEEVRFYYFNGVKYEKQLTWDENGRKASETLQSKHLAFNDWYYWNKKGKLIGQKLCFQKLGKGKYSERCSETEFFEDGSLKSLVTTIETNKYRKQPSSNAVSEGIQITCYPNGQLKSIGYNKDGKRSGPYQEYYEDGQIKADLLFRNGQEYGKLTHWYPNGNKQSELYQGVYFMGDRIRTIYYGKYTRWYESGQLQHVDHYNLRGLLHGESLTWDETGKLILKIYYRNGRVVSSRK